MTTSTRSRLAAVLAALALLLGGVAPSAGATEIKSIKGRVELPQGEEAWRYTPRLYAFDWNTGKPFATGSPAVKYEDGRFSFNGVAGDRDYLVLLEANSEDYLGGFYTGEGEALSPYFADAERVHAGDEISLVPVKGEHLTVTYSVPPTVDSSGPGSFFWVQGREVLAEDEGVGEWQERSISDRTGPTIDLVVRPGSFIVIGVFNVWPDTPTIQNGWVHAPLGLVADLEHATPFYAGTGHLPITATHVTPQLTKLADPVLRGTAQVGETLTASQGAWSVLGTRRSFQWLRDGKEIPGATASTYVLGAADRGARLAARVTISASELGEESATTAQSAKVAAGRAPRATAVPRLSGTARLGGTLRATAGSWDQPGVRLAYQWLRGGKAIKGATKSSLKLGTADVGQRISVRVTSSRAGYLEGTSTSSALKVAKGKPKVTASAKSVKAKKRATVKVKVKVAGLAKPAGTVTVKYGKRSTKVKLKASAKGKVSVKLPKLKKGRYSIKVSFKPTGSSARYIGSGKAAKFSLRVR